MVLFSFSSDLLKRHRKTCSVANPNGKAAKAASATSSTESRRSLSVSQHAPGAPIINANGGQPVYDASFDTSMPVASGSGSRLPPPVHAHANWYPQAKSSYAHSTGSGSGLSGNSPNAPSLSPPDGFSSSGTTSPETPFSDVSLTREWEKSYALDPALSLPFQMDQFSEEELLASEVLEVSPLKSLLKLLHQSDWAFITHFQDLLRSPQYSPGLVSPSIQHPIFSPNTVSTLRKSTPWHGGKAVPGPGHENTTVVGSGGWDPFSEPNGIEFSPAAVSYPLLDLGSTLI